MQPRTLPRNECTNTADLCRNVHKPCFAAGNRAPKQGPLVLYLPCLESWAVTRAAVCYDDVAEGLEQREPVPAASRRPEAAAAAAAAVIGGSPRAMPCSPRIGSKAFAAAASPFG